MKIIPDMPAAEYHAHPAVSKSVLDRIARSPLHARAYLDGVRDEPSAAMQFGTALHTCVLEPERFAAEFAVFEGDRRTKDGKARYEELVGRGLAIVSAADFAAITAMAAAVRQHPVAGSLLERGTAEQSVFWTDPVTGLQLKARPDWQVGSTLVDVKTTEDASPAAFARSVASYRYHVQDAHYTEGMQADRFLFVVIEKRAPHAVAVYELDDEARRIGRQLRARDLQAFASCDEFGIWPGYTPEVTTLALPKWATHQENDSE